MSASNRIIVAMLGVATLAVAFWMLLLSPKRDEVTKLEGQVAQQKELLAVHRSEVQRGLEAERNFPVEYQQLVVLGKAAPSDSETASLLVQLNRISRRAKVKFQTFSLSSSGEAGAEEAEGTEAGSAAAEGSSEYASATEVAASKMPLGASVGPAGLAVMPYSLLFKGSFFHIADFIHGLDSLVKTTNARVDVTGRLITVNAFSLKPDSGRGFPHLEGSFSINTYLVPPGQGITGGATPTAPESGTAEQVSATTGAAP